ncbi:chromosomal replication initiator protein DnaA [Candidatus Roizmanbacteria bacterium RIFCSPHIGHO2_02_FULL_37_15]|uniref:Chromosomal replication initiator protein DnaA n=1 Tax=Candidatus Roizmanbacteria bacterium RIFCSPLOWO2_01_FULL_37_16 TaxID=1802058 RepID=A0A1F7INY1_9BACT|nr:MAG: chromosomal replication initiator protein DnaA [Candidatus Roizmanbacteria bacterium RIFCSPHIGHO2_01_FULL_37_16b]OGK21351.1 MAG: chromosomal replication initiator protein DnaA [Candidatus Roizmanbacteria bacterium RIFCSPHIGHO2_02_FULL_37_15]OGK45041.1 MAG: chromosomal replication initiator protein DnaA [Candidatus Roizmanbacteria bacterium RIFCSPLOWO2_01_FULL_37_16]
MSILSSFWDQFIESIAKNQKKYPLLFPLLKQIHPVELTEEKIVLSCQNQGLKFYLDKGKPHEELEDSLSEQAGKRIRIELSVTSTKKRPKDAPLLNFQPTLSDLYYKTGLLSKYSFDNFAVSSTNQVAHAAAQAVTNGLGHAYNPLLLYGGVGVGKTHLAQAIGRNVLEKDQDKKIFFCPSDQFTNELIESIREKSTPGFRRKYRRLNLLILDDVQFIAGKEKVQEEFFHTFNSLVSAGGQVILTADQPPSQIKNLEDRLRSRFSGGLIVDIQPPDFELRTAILLIKAREKNIEIDIESAKAIAERVSDSRELEGTLLTLYSKVLGNKEFIDFESVRAFFSKKQEALANKLLPQDVLKTVSSFYNIRPSHLKSGLRTSNVVLPRQVAMFILRNYLKMKLSEIAFFLKRKDHTTVMHAIDKINRLTAKDPLIKREVDQIIQSLNLST